MNLKDALLELQEKDNLLGVYQERVSHLNRLSNEGAQIPIYNSTEEFVDPGYMEEVLSLLEAKFEEILNERDLILGWSVDDGKNKNPTPTKRRRRKTGK